MFSVQKPLLLCSVPVHVIAASTTFIHIIVNIEFSIFYETFTCNFNQTAYLPIWTRIPSVSKDLRADTQTHSSIEGAQKLTSATSQLN